MAGVQFIYGSSKPAVAEGTKGGWFTKGGTPIEHPGAYGKIGWSNMEYLTNDERVTVGIDWLYSRMPREVETYLLYKDRNGEGIDYETWVANKKAKSDLVYNSDDPALAEASYTGSRIFT